MIMNISALRSIKCRFPVCRPSSLFSAGQYVWDKYIKKRSPNIIKQVAS